MGGCRSPLPYLDSPEGKGGWMHRPPGGVFSCSSAPGSVMASPTLPIPQGRVCGLPVAPLPSRPDPLMGELALEQNCQCSPCPPLQW